MSNVRRAIYFQIAGFGAIFGLLLLASRFFPINDWLALVQQKVMSHGAWSVAWYPLLYACCNVLLLPGGLLSIGGGFFFGLWWGFLVILVGNVGGAAISFLLSRLGRKWLKNRFRSRTLSALEPAVEREGWKLVLLSQLHPLFPTSLLNYLYGLTTIRFRTCMLWVAIGQAPGLFLYAYIGTLGQLSLNLFRGKTHPHAIEFWIWLGGFALAIVVLFLIGQIALGFLKQVETSRRSFEFRAYKSQGEPELIRHVA